MTQPFSYVPVTTPDGQQAYEVIAANGRGTGIIRTTKLSANGCAQTMNHNAQRLINQRARAEARKP